MLIGNKPIGTIAYMGGVLALPEVFAWCWGQMIQYNAQYLVEPGQGIHYERSTISFHAAARNNLVDRMRGDWLLMLDTDMTFEPDLAARLLHRAEKHHLDVLVGLYQYKSPPHSPTLYRWDEDHHLEAIGEWSRDVDVFEVGSAGAGCLFVRRTVYQRIRHELQESPFDITPPFGEDHSFFNRVQRLGMKAYCCPAIQTYHLRLHPLTLSDYDRTDLHLSERYTVEGFA